MVLSSLKPSATALRIGSAAILVVIGAWVLYTYPPVTSGFYPQCVFKKATGLDCPGCGTTRALHALLHGHVFEAFTLNPFLFAILIGFACAAPSLMRGETPRFVMKPWFGWGSLVVVTGWWIGRNLMT